MDQPHRLHCGIDITAELGDTVHAAAAGRVAYADNGVRGYGNLLILLHAGGSVSAYAHLARIEVRLGQKVERGAGVGRVAARG